MIVAVLNKHHYLSQKQDKNGRHGISFYLFLSLVPNGKDNFCDNFTDAISSWTFVYFSDHNPVLFFYLKMTYHKVNAYITNRIGAICDMHALPQHFDYL